MIDRLAKQQAYQLFIEQEIEKGLAAGKSKYSIGKEIAEWIKKLFQADVKPKTISKRAERIATNVATESTAENQREIEEIQDSTVGHGGARKGAGRPPKFSIRALTIDPEFHALLPPLTKEEMDGLEASIKEDGCRDPLIVWDGILLDGHARYEICRRLNIPFEIHNVSFDDRYQAMIWIIQNQLGRTNLSPQQKAALREARAQIISHPSH